MVAISPTKQSALTALSLLRPPSNVLLPVSSASRAAGLDPASGVRLSPGASDAIMKINEILQRHETQDVPLVARSETADDPGGYIRGPRTELADLPMNQAEWLRALGADEVVNRTARPVSDAAFRNLVLEHGKESWTGLDGFNEALANGTLNIQRASDVPELRLGSSLYDLYKNGSHIGSAYIGNGTFNMDLYLEIQSQGTRQATGSVDGHAYYVTWPDAGLEKD